MMSLVLLLLGAFDIYAGVFLGSGKNPMIDGFCIAVGIVLIALSIMESFTSRGR